MREERTYFVYILASRPYGTLYIGVTNDLYRRIQQHREGVVQGFTKKYGVARVDDACAAALKAGGSGAVIGVAVARVTV